LKTLTIILTDGPYISEYAEMAAKIARAALKQHRVNIFLYLDAVHIPKAGQSPSIFKNAGELFQELAKEGVVIRACSRCAAARGYLPEENGVCKDYYSGLRIGSLYDLADMLKCSDRVIALSG
jgi:tRNA 2-thiouridine synthesizing protein D